MKFVKDVVSVFFEISLAGIIPHRAEREMSAVKKEYSEQ